MEEALEDFQGTILAVSHDRYFLNKLFPRTAWLEQGELTTFEGPYEWARGKWDELQARHQVEEVKSVELLGKVKPIRVRDILSRPIEEEIAELETAIVNITRRIENQEDWEVYEQLLSEKSALEFRLEGLLEQWLESS